MEKAVRAKQVTTRLVERIDDGKTVVLHTTPDLQGLPEWVQDAWDTGLFIMIQDDGFTGLWVVTPYGYAMRAEPGDILVNRGEGYISLWR